MYHRCLLEAVFCIAFPLSRPFRGRKTISRGQYFSLWHDSREMQRIFCDFAGFRLYFAVFLRKIAEVFLPLSPFFPEKGDGEFVNDA